MVEYPWAESDTFPITESLVCCCEETGCFLTVPNMLLDGTDTPFADETEAQDALDNLAADCLVWLNEPGGTWIRTGVSAAVVGDTLSFAETITHEGSSAGDNSLLKLVAAAAGTISFPFSLSMTLDAGPAVDMDIEITLYDEDGNFIDADADFNEEESSLSGTLSLTVPAAGVYYIHVVPGSSGDPSEATECALTVEYSASMTGAQFCSIRAAYGATPNYLVCA